MSRIADLEADRLSAMPEETIGQRIKKCRAASGLFQEQLAEQIGKVRPTIVQYEGGKILPPIDVIEDIARVLDVSPAYLAFGRIDEAARFPSSGQITIPMQTAGRDQPDSKEDILISSQIAAGLDWPESPLRAFRLEVKAPHFGLNTGDILIVEIDRNEIRADGAIYATPSPGGAMVVRSEALPGQNNGPLILTGPNGATFTPQIALQPLGRVVGWIHAHA